MQHVESRQFQLNSGQFHLFDEETLNEVVIRPSACRPVDTPNYAVSETTMAAHTIFSQAIKDSYDFGHRLYGRWSGYPHIVIKQGNLAWTSVQVVLRK